MDKHQTPRTFSGEVKQIASEDVKESKYTIAQISGAIAGLTGRPLSAEMLAAFIDQAQPNHFPLDIVPAWVRITGSRRLIEFLLEKI